MQKPHPLKFNYFTIPLHTPHMQQNPNPLPFPKKTTKQIHPHILPLPHQLSHLASSISVTLSNRIPTTPGASLEYPTSAAKTNQCPSGMRVPNSTIPLLLTWKTPLVPHHLVSEPLYALPQSFSRETLINRTIAHMKEGRGWDGKGGKGSYIS